MTYLPTETENIHADFMDDKNTSVFCWLTMWYSSISNAGEFLR